MQLVYIFLIPFTNKIWGGGEQVYLIYTSICLFNHIKKSGDRTGTAQQQE